jgi:hypothetical protein
LESQGIYVPKKERVIPAKLRELNEERKATNRNRIEEAIARLEGMGGINALPRITDVRLRERFGSLWANGIKMNNLKNLALKPTGGHTQMLYTPTLVCVPTLVLKLTHWKQRKTTLAVCVSSLCLSLLRLWLCVSPFHGRKNKRTFVQVTSQERRNVPPISPPLICPRKERLQKEGQKAKKKQAWKGCLRTKYA